MRKSTRLSSIGLTQVREPVKTFRTRFSLTSFTKRVQRLTAEQRSAISRTGFGSLLSVPNQTLNKVFLTEVMEAWDSERRVFAVGTGEISMSLLDVALILGVPVVGDPVVLTEEEAFSEMEEVYGAARGKRKVAMGSLEARLDSIGDVVSDDFVRTFLLYTIGTFLSSNDAKVDSRYLNFLCDLEGVSGFAWGGAVVEDLCQWLDKRKQNNVQYVGGCLVFLQAWCYEHFDIARPLLQDLDLTFPRVCRWDSKSHLKQRGTSTFKDLHDDQVIWELQPTYEELQIGIIKEALQLQGDSEELQRPVNCSPSTSTNVSGVDSESQLSISNEVHREDEVNFENQVVEDTPTRLSTSGEVNREQENNFEKLRVEETPPNLSIGDKVHKEQEMNGEKLIVEETLTILNTVDDVGREEEFHVAKHIVEDTPTSLSIADEVGKEQEFSAEDVTVDNAPPILSFCDDDIRKKNVLLEEENAVLKMKISQLMISNTQVEEQNAELNKERDFLREENRTLRLLISDFVARMDRHDLDLETNAIELHPETS
ncbi:protein MAINTENANCE OF MERISTEMS-like [Lotus japonicus]|uniref:protein MAINTENANCE OF MERISTEMS-like n=1 Tax=Lotus japonicus TaxID=34305 RepID=UPI00258E53B5|nr:protein MAINTENANCE OF MERISTEMS-like [Lotus japonicus]